MFRGGFSGDRGGYERGRGGRGRGRGGMDGGERLTQIQIQIKNKYKLRNYAWYGHSLINIWKHRNNDDKHNHSLIRFLNFLSSNSRRGSGNLTIQSCNVFFCWNIKLWGSWFPLFQLNWYLYSIDQRQSLYGDQRDKVEGRLDHKDILIISVWQRREKTEAPLSYEILANPNPTSTGFFYVLLVAEDFF